MPALPEAPLLLELTTFLAMVTVVVVNVVYWFRLSARQVHGDHRAVTSETISTMEIHVRILKESVEHWRRLAESYEKQLAQVEEELATLKHDAELVG